MSDDIVERLRARAKQVRENIAIGEKGRQPWWPARTPDQFAGVELDETAADLIARHSEAHLRDVLRGHWLWQVECDHANKTDTPRCSCSRLACEPQPSIGQAVERWIDHVLSELARAANAPEGQP